MTTPSGPFPPDPGRASRNAGLLDTCGAAFGDALAGVLAGGQRDPRHPAAVVGSVAVAQLMAAFDLHEPEEAAVLALATARTLARPPVSGYRVGAAALAADGDLLLGGNVEWPGASIWQTVHAEGFVTLLARARGTRLASLVTDQARPCAHCRQVLAEMDGAGDLVLADPAGRRLRLTDLYPWPFVPADLDVARAGTDDTPFPFLGLASADMPGEIASALIAAGRRAHAPYSGAPAACVLVLADGSLVPGTVLESVAFNPTIGPVQDALVGLLAAGREPDRIEAAWLAVARGAAIGHEAAARDALEAAAPGVPLRVTTWT
jgi:cytidine deaminase